MSIGQPVQYFPQQGEIEIKDNTSGGMADNDNVRFQISNKEPMAAIITRVWGPSCVNVIVFPDCSHPVIRTSVSLGSGPGNFSPLPTEGPVVSATTDDLWNSFLRIETPVTLVGTKQYRLGRMIMSHMASDNLAELFEMADRIDVDKRHFQNKPGRPHFDVCQSKKKLAVQYGAKLVHDSEIVIMLKTNYSKMTDQDKAEIRQIIREELNARLGNASFATATFVGQQQKVMFPAPAPVYITPGFPTAVPDIPTASPDY